MMAEDFDKTMMVAIKMNDWNAVEKALAQGAKAEGSDGKGAPLLEAARHQNFVIAAILVAAGASIGKTLNLAHRNREAFNQGEDPVRLDYERDYVANGRIVKWLTEQRQEITERALKILVERVARLDGVERQLAELKEAVDEIVNPKAIEKRKLQAPQPPKVN